MKGNGKNLDRVLDFVEDSLTRSSMPFVLLGQTLKSICDKDRLEGDKIELGVQKKHLADSSVSILKSLIPGIEIGDDKMTFTHEGVEVEIRIIKKKYGFLKYPNVLFYKVAEYQIPNPLESYWKIHQIVR